MNIVKRFLAKKQPVILDELIIIPSGQLYLVRSPSSPKSENECLYNDAALTIRNTIHQYNYELVLWKGNESDSDSLNDEEDENSEAQDEFFENESNVLKSFVIDQNLKVCLFERYGEKIISWKDMEGDFGDMFEYRINKSVPNDTIEQFMTCIYKYEYEKKYEKSSEFVTAKELQEFIVERSELFDSCLDSAYTPSSSSTINMLQLLNKNENKVEYGEDNDSFYENSNSDSDSDSNSEGEDYAKFEDAAETLYSDISNDDLKQRIPLDDFPCKSYIYDPTSEEFKPKHLNVSVFLYELSNWTYCMEVKDRVNGANYLVAALSNQMDPAFRFEQLAFIFNVFTSINAFTWLLKFQDKDTYEKFQSIFMKLHWQYKNQQLWPTNATDEHYLVNTFEDMDIDDPHFENNLPEDTDSSTDSDSEEEVAGTSNLRETKYKARVDFEESEDEETRFVGSSKNTGLVLGLKTDNAFISRGDKIGIFRTDDGTLQFSTTIDKLTFSKNGSKPIVPSKMLLLENDKTMIIQDNKNRDKLHKLDLEYGKIVEDWELRKNDKDIPIESFTTNTKFGDLMNDPTFVGVSSQSMFKVDPRIQNGFVSNDKTYKTKTNFKQVSTTGKGYLAVASKNGEIRLYDQLGKNAKTLLPALGDEIRGLTTSNDGRYVLATCKTYLLLIDVLIQSGKYENKLGFERSFGIDAKPMPKKLQLKPEHIAYIKKKHGLDVKFSVAKFNETSRGDEPTYIVSSVGPFAITWNFRKVLNNVRDSYKIRAYQDDVIMGEFINKNNKKMVLTLSDDITMTSTSSFKAPKYELSVVKTAF